ncbi:MAG: hypothetical protein ACRCXX_13850 [Cetobacterium sp.]|uniref:hypothetical protein n=1 Tax=Cetobacterium sp. TaxID=2071632 RepID=UPI003F31C55F
MKKIKRVFFVNDMEQNLIDDIQKLHDNVDLVSDRDERFLKHVEEEYQGEKQEFYIHEGSSLLNYQDYPRVPFVPFMILRISGKYFILDNINPDFLDYNPWEFEKDASAPFDFDIDLLDEDIITEALYEIRFKVVNVNGMKHENDFYIPDEAPMEDILPHIIEGRAIEIKDVDLVEKLKQSGYVHDVIVDLDEVLNGNYISVEDHKNMDEKELNIENVIHAVAKRAGLKS